MCIRLHLLHTSALYDTYSVASVSALYDSDEDDDSGWPGVDKGKVEIGKEMRRGVEGYLEDKYDVQLKLVSSIIKGKGPYGVRLETGA